MSTSWRGTPFARAVLLTIILGGGVALAGFGTDAFGTLTDQSIVLNMLITMIIVIGLFLFSGTSGILVFSHVGFVAIGAYASVLLTIPVAQKMDLYPDLPSFLNFIHSTEMGILPAAILAGLIAAAVGALLAIALVRLNGAAANISSFAFLVIVYAVVTNWTGVTRGLKTVVGVPLYTTMTAAVLTAVAAIAVAAFYQESRYGLRLRASRDNEAAARALGINIERERGIAFVLSAFFLGIAGCLFAHFITVFGPDSFYLQLTFTTVVMLVVGGITTLTGAVLGTALVTWLSEFLRDFEAGGLGPIGDGGLPGLTTMILGLMLLVILALRPRGITNGQEITSWRLPSLRFPRRPRGGSEAAEPEV